MLNFLLLFWLNFFHFDYKAFSGLPLNLVPPSGEVLALSIRALASFWIVADHYSHLSMGAKWRHSLVVMCRFHKCWVLPPVDPLRVIHHYLRLEAVVMGFNIPRISDVRRNHLLNVAFRCQLVLLGVELNLVLKFRRAISILRSLRFRVWYRALLLIGKSSSWRHLLELRIFQRVPRFFVIIAEKVVLVGCIHLWCHIKAILFVSQSLVSCIIHRQSQGVPLASDSVGVNHIFYPDIAQSRRLDVFPG